MLESVFFLSRFMTLPPCKWLMVWPGLQSCWQPLVLLKPDFHQHYFEHLLKIQISGSHCKWMVLWVFSGLVLWAVTGNHRCLEFPGLFFPNPYSLCVTLSEHVPLLICFIYSPVISLTFHLVFWVCSKCLEINGWSECIGMVIFWGLVLVYKDGRLNSRTSH